ncbi:MAG: ATP-binding protein [Chlamydiia bacterium]|nr:ATP-binding protein [Chlamydiia bacterium]
MAKAYKTHSVVAILGPRQCGKTTLARQYIDFAEKNVTTHFFDLEDPADLAALANPKAALDPLSGLIILDEIQRIPELFPLLRVLVDAPKSNKRFLILGSASRDLIRQSSESLAGRIAYLELPPFAFFEVDDKQSLWLKGGFPKAFLADTIEDSIYWRKQYISTFLERDIPNLGIRIAPTALRRFWMMLAHYHGQIFQASDIGKSLGIADTTARHYLDILTGTFMIRQLQPWIENIKKRQVKRPKIYFRDSGILHTLCDITDYTSLLRHPKLGASWEGFALEETIRSSGAEPDECYFWGIHNTAELDLLIMQNGKRLGFEFKYSDAPKITASMRIALDHLKLDSLIVIYPGEKDFTLDNKIHVKSLSSLRSMWTKG